MVKQQFILYVDYKFTGIEYLQVARVDKKTNKMFIIKNDFDFHTGKTRVKFDDVRLILDDRNAARTLKHAIDGIYGAYRATVEDAQKKLYEGQQELMRQYNLDWS